jgi:biopolymer transport protein ExbD
MGMAAGASKGAMSDINVTPFVDVCLVLLIIFMVVTPMLQEGLAINLPVASNTQKTEDDEENAIVVKMNGPRSVYIQKKQIPREQYLAEMTEVHDRMPEKPVLIKADKTLAYGDVRKLMIDTNEAGFETISLVTEKPPGEED